MVGPLLIEKEGWGENPRNFPNLLSHFGLSPEEGDKHRESAGVAASESKPKLIEEL
jgi:hypothetical protein